VTQAELEITAELVRDLLRDQHPDLADRPVTLGARGWDNQLWRLAPVWVGPALWIHGDLHPANLLTADGTFCGVIDFGDMCAGDPACDLAAPWILLPDGAADRFRGAYRPALDAATLRRARGWAVLRALVGLQ
jgi:aminoglycoside phosphotransferase (APT) family kinase protein